MTRRIFVFACAVLTACSATSASLTSAPQGARPRSLGSSDFVPVEELRRYEDTGSLFEFLTRVRPNMITPRRGARTMPGSRGDIDVFINGQYTGSSDVLRGLQPQFVASVRMMQRSQAFATYGGWLRGEHALFVTLLR